MKELPAWCGLRAGQGREPDGQQGEIRRRTLINGPMELRWRLGRPVPRSLRRNVRCEPWRPMSRRRLQRRSARKRQRRPQRQRRRPRPSLPEAREEGREGSRKRRLRRSRKRPLRRSRKAAAKKPKRPPEKARKGCEEVGRRQENKRGDKKRSAAKEHETPRTQGGPRREARQEEAARKKMTQGHGERADRPSLDLSAIERPASASAPLYRGNLRLTRRRGDRSAGAESGAAGSSSVPGNRRASSC